MPKKLEPSLSRCNHATILRITEDLVRSGLSIEEVGDILDEIEGWLAWQAHPSPDVWEGPEGWYRIFSTFVIEGASGATCLFKIWRKERFQPREGMVNLDRPDTWKSRPKPPKGKG